MEGPVMSASRIPTLYPLAAIAFAREPVTKDFPTPPLPLTTPITCFTSEKTFCSAIKFCGLLFSLLAHPSQLVLPQEPLLLHSAISIYSFDFRSYTPCLSRLYNLYSYFINLSIARSSSLIASLSPCSTASTIQCSI